MSFLHSIRLHRLHFHVNVFHQLAMAHFLEYMSLWGFSSCHVIGLQRYFLLWYFLKVFSAARLLSLQSPFPFALVGSKYVEVLGRPRSLGFAQGLCDVVTLRLPFFLLFSLSSTVIILPALLSCAVGAVI